MMKIAKIPRGAGDCLARIPIVCMGYAALQAGEAFCSRFSTNVIEFLDVFGLHAE